MKTHSASCVDVLNDSLTIVATDEIGSGGANHRWEVRTDNGDVVASVQFQNGPRGDLNSIAGVTHAAIVALLLEQLRQFQLGPYPSRETALIITKLEETLDIIHRRTRERANRGVLGKAMR
jgi:hypothetical protein